MKNFKSLYILFCAIGLSTLLSCDLELQKPTNFDASVKPLVTFQDKTVWEWLQTQKSPALPVIDQFKFDYLIQAIERAGMIEEFNRKTDKRTFLLLNNNAFDDPRQIFQTLTTKVTGPVSAIPVEKLKAILNYHILTDYVLQIPNLEVYGTEYPFQSLIVGDAGKVVLRRDERYFITVNPTSNPPLTSTRIGASVRSHNYQMANGVAHIMNAYVRNLPF